jgi:hypothetical protein
MIRRGQQQALRQVEEQKYSIWAILNDIQESQHNALWDCLFICDIFI